MSLNIEFISAGAGSGKTYTLTKKLKELLAINEINPRGVIATTFTRMAAGELRERVREALMQSGQIELANQMGQASINTVNGVCGELLKRFSFEAGLSPEQIVLEEGQAQRLFGEAMDLVLDASGTEVKKLNGLAHRLSFYDKGNPEWYKHVKKIADAARSNNCDLSQLPHFAIQSTKELLSHFRKPTNRDLDGELLVAINTTLATIDPVTDTTKTTREYIQLIKGVQAALYKHRVTWAEWVKLSNKNPAVKSKQAAEPIKLVAAEYELHPKLQDDISEYNIAVFQLAASSLAAYQKLKKQQGLVDFVDQELQLYRLLEDPEVQQTLNSELQLLMVDEFQDTSPIQLALFVRLAAFAKKVIWVGDIKQAIYGFRGSDPSLMQAVLKVIIAQGKDVQILEKSWRSRPALVEYCNNIFSEAFANTIPREQVELIPAREELTGEPAVQKWLMSGSNMAKKMASIAAEIKKLVEDGYNVVDKQTKKTRHVVYGDIAALCRSNSRLAVLAKACNDAGISVGYKRPGLLATPEGALGMACLKRLADPMDTLASAEIISLVSCGSVDEWLPDRIKHLQSGLKSSQWGEITGEAGEHKTEVLGAIATVRKSLNILTPKEAIKEAIAKGNVRAVINQWGPNTNKCKDRLANIDCLIELAGDYEQHCEVLNIAATVSGLVMWLYELHDTEEDWQAVGKDNDTMTLVTHHGAKGLEWPVVLAVDLEKDVRTRLWDLSVKAREDEFDVKAPLEGRSLQFWPYPFGQLSAGIDLKDKIEASEAGIQAKQQAIEEEKRLLYVSLTRPRDLLIIPLPPKGTCKALDTLGGDWILPEGDSLTLPNGKEIPTRFKECVVDEEITSSASYKPHWLPELEKAKQTMPRKFSPSSTEPIATASIGTIIRLGERLPMEYVDDMSSLGTAFHGVIAAAINHTKPITIEQASELLNNFGVRQSLKPEHAIEASERFIKHINQQYDIIQCLPEYPISMVNELNQEANGYIDLLIETTKGWIIIDHKSSPAPRSEWKINALKYSGQLDIYRKAIEKVSDKPVLGCWIHFALTGGMVEVL